MKEGYIKLYRSIEDNPLWTQEPFTKAQAWLDILLLTNINPGILQTKNGEMHKIERGECAWSMKRLAARWRWSEGKVKRFFCFLNDEKMIVQKDIAKLTIIKVLNFDKYQKQRTNDSSNSSINGAQTAPIEERKERKEYTTTILENFENQKIYGKYNNVCLTAEQYNRLQALCMSQKLLDELIDSLSTNIAEGKEKAYQADFPEAHAIRIEKYFEYRRKNPQKFTNKVAYKSKAQEQDDCNNAIAEWAREWKEKHKGG